MIRAQSRSFICPAAYLLCLLLGSPLAGAQLFELTAAGSLNARAQPALSFGLTAKNVALVAGFGLDARVLADVGGGGGIETAGLLNIPLNTLTEALTFYTGPGLALGTGRAVRLRPSLTAGLSYRLGGQINLFAEGSYQWQRQFRARSGVTYSF
jgi:hypothetical protein